MQFDLGKGCLVVWPSALSFGIALRERLIFNYSDADYGVKPFLNHFEFCANLVSFKSSNGA